jgi:hypothetical protein
MDEWLNKPIDSIDTVELTNILVKDLAHAQTKANRFKT